MKVIKGVIGVIIGILIIIGVIFVFLHLKSGSGREIGSENTSKLSKETSKDKDEIVIKVTETKIYIDDKECEDVSELRDEISKFEAKNSNIKFSFYHKYAIKETADEVTQALHRLQDSLGIKVDYND